VAVVERLEDLVHDETETHVSHFCHEGFEGCIVHVFEDQPVGFRHFITDAVMKGDDVGTTAEITQDIDLTLDLTLLDGFQNLGRGKMNVLDEY